MYVCMDYILWIVSHMRESGWPDKLLEERRNKNEVFLFGKDKDDKWYWFRVL